jgi:hypothetical protein
MILKEEFVDWKSDHVTKAFFEAALDRVDDAKEILGQSAGLDSDQDNYMRGFIAAYKEMLDFRVDE